ncbi:MAG: Apocarotenoid-15,15'-oxygenase [Chloroflexales bacterium]|nr:Apocarotenoid-15,15'-oxygenase [Chloroflexales bacterium]
MSVETLPEAGYTLAGDWARGYESQPIEHAFWIDAVEGVIPPELHGTLYRNGPGLLEAGGLPVHHPFDGDGMVVAVSFRDGRAYYRNRFVQTAGYVAEQRAGRPLYRGVFGTQLPGGWAPNFLNLRLKNIANTSVLHWGDRLLALWEAGEPHRLDPDTLATIGLDRLDGLLRAGQAFAAHYHIDPFSHWDGGDPALVNFGVSVGLNTTIDLFEFDRDFRALRHQAFQLDGFAFLHDMAITPNYIIFVRNPMRYDPIPYALGLWGAAQGLRSLPGQPSTVLVFPRHPSLGRPRSFSAPSGFVWHHANAFEDGDTLVVDSVWYDHYVGIGPEVEYRTIDFASLPPGRMARMTIDLGTGRLERSFLAGRCCEFPALHPAKVGRPYRYTYLGAADAPEGNAPLQAIWKLDLETDAQQLWSAAPRGFVSEPIFVPRPRTAAHAGAVTPDLGDPLANSAPGEDDGWLLTLVYNAARHESEVVILDARDLGRGPIARLRLGHHVPHGLHGMFTSRAAPP